VGLIWEKSRLAEKDFFKRFGRGASVGSLLPFGKGTVCADFAGLRGDVARAEGANGWISIRIWAIN
jgi:hypothetical protein